MKLRSTIAALGGITAALASAGCGGGHTDTSKLLAGGRGVIAITIRWPTGSRLIPVAAKSIRVTATGGQEVVVPRPTGTQTTTTVNIGEVLAGQVAVTASAYPNADGTGTAQASGTVIVTVQPGKTVNTSLTMGSAITHVQVSPPNPSVQVGDTLSLTASALDASNSVVLTAPFNWQWSFPDASMATVTPNGDAASVKGVATGQPTLTVTEKESGRSIQVTVAVGSGGAAQSYTVTELGPPGGSGTSQASAINKLGHVVGQYSTYGGDSRAFIWDGQGVRNLTNWPGGGLQQNEIASAINDHDQAAGSFQPYLGDWHAAYFAQGLFWCYDLGRGSGINNQGVAAGVDIQTVPFRALTYQFEHPELVAYLPPLVDGYDAGAAGINDAGQVVGNAQSPQGSRPVVWDGGIIRPLAGLDAAMAINRDGDVAGAFGVAKSGGTGNETHAALWRSGNVVDLGFLGDRADAEALALNNRGLVVGYFNVTVTAAPLVTDIRAFVWDQQSGMRDLNSLIPAGSGWVLQQATGVNDAGRICGSGTRNGVQRAFVLNPAGRTSRLAW